MWFKKNQSTATTVLTNDILMSVDSPHFELHYPHFVGLECSLRYSWSYNSTQQTQELGWPKWNCSSSYFFNCSRVMWGPTVCICCPLAMVFTISPLCHWYADVSQLYVSFSPENENNLDSLHCCLTLARNLFLISTSTSLSTLRVLFNHAIYKSEILLKSNQCSPKTLIHTLISSCLDYCNSLFTCLNVAVVAYLQLVQNLAAHHSSPGWITLALSITGFNLRFYWLLLNPYMVWLHFTFQNS